MDYSDQTAAAYGSYRPPLHEIILNRLLGNSHVKYALDVGSGTGTSTEALLSYASEITGIEPSSQMISECEKHPSIQYIKGRLPYHGFADGEFQLISFAGSINYCHSKEVFQDMMRILGDEGMVVVYDFRLPLAEMLSIEVPPVNYDHGLNWSEYATGHLTEEKKIRETFLLNCSKEEFITLCRAEHGVNEQLPNGWTESLRASIKIEATLYGILYRVLPR